MANKERKVGVYPKNEYDHLGEGQFLISKSNEINRVVEGIERDYGKENIMLIKSALSFVTTDEESLVGLSILFKVN